ncbi:SMP-30/gluconolactonase/LRE family protein [Paenibacillus sp. TRM 82003]|uniref:SMP-30/gluconolactonase/LRE family protein n=1 Tax=Kineococcus sp. TRM81007 TaxID=2925831 RepID=UPI001F585F92|nr:SMP-30/gluconolactonase/LRE family protein [Kineococcus sp. TRM81007]MCI2240314.1 SMP-30/gluconolactonase/LRE family protein [Kineococcus sp. TRM81007]MCI3927509.1 SMP-30/gluconolactonase/LRE family protein [Paenibacillus sp. TRM 82003]
MSSSHPTGRARFLDQRGHDLLDRHAHLERLGTGSTWAEGPLWLPQERALVVSDIPGDRVLRWDEAGGLRVDRERVGFTNGRTLDHQGREVFCSHGRRSVERREHDGSTTVLADRYGGARLNSPNDVVVASDGAVWFTDPPYGISVPEEGHEGFREYGDNLVFRLDAGTGELRVVVADVEEPNGLAFSPDESLLYVADTSAAATPGGGSNRLVRVYDVRRGTPGGRGPDARPGGPVAKNGRVFASMDRGLADGFRVDTAGNVWTSNGDAVTVLAPDGTRLLEVVVGEVVANLCFGGPEGTDVFVAASTSLYRLRTRATGAGLWWLGG